MSTEILRETDVTLKVLKETDDEVQEERQREAWEKVYQARQNNSILKTVLSGVEYVQDAIVGVVFIDNLIKGIIPLEHSGCDSPDQLKRLIGQEIYFKVTALDREGEQFAASITEAVEHLQKLTWDRLEEGIKVEARIVAVYMKRLRLDIGAISVILPVEEVSHDWIDDLRDVFKPGDKIQVRITELDKEEQKLVVSRRATLPSPWPDCLKRYVKGGIYPGTVVGKVEYGIFVNLEPGLNCLTPHTHPRVGNVEKGDTVFVKIRRIQPVAQKMSGKIERKI